MLFINIFEINNILSQFASFGFFYILLFIRIEYRNKVKNAVRNYYFCADGGGFDVYGYHTFENKKTPSSSHGEGRRTVPMGFSTEWQARISG